jgi:hypothetical protein
LAASAFGLFAAPALGAPQWSVKVTQLNAYGKRGLTDPSTGSPSSFDRGSGANIYTVTLENSAPRGNTPAEEKANTVGKEATVNTLIKLPPGVLLEQESPDEHGVLGRGETSNVCELQQGVAAETTTIKCSNAHVPEVPPGVGAHLQPMNLKLYIDPATGIEQGTGIEQPVFAHVTVSGHQPAPEETPFETSSVSPQLELATVPFELELFKQRATQEPNETQKKNGEPGAPETQAGGHPFAFETELLFTSVPSLQERKLVTAGGGQIENGVGPKEVLAELPPGFIGDVQNGETQCPLATFASNTSGGCPLSSAVGFIHVLTSGENYIGETLSQGHETLIYNLVPPPGHPAAFGLKVKIGSEEASAPVILYAKIRSDGDYGATVGTEDSATLRGSLVTFCGYGVEQAKGVNEVPECKSPHTSAPASKPLLANPTQCSATPLTTLRANRWLEPAEYTEAHTALLGESEGHPLQLTGCQALMPLFEPSLKFEPSSPAEGGTAQPGAPSAMTVTVNQPEERVNPSCVKNGPSTVECPPIAPALKKLEMTLPEGVSLSPSSAQGLTACKDAEFGLGTEFQEVEEEKAGHRVVSHRKALKEPAQEAHCPASSQIGTVEVTSPDLPKEADGSGQLKGALYVAQPECAVCSPSDAANGRLFRLFLQLTDRKAGLVVKLTGRSTPNLSTGQLTTTFEDQPQLPFEKLVLHLKGGPRAVLQNPQSCTGSEQTHAVFTSWASETPQPVNVPFAVECPSAVPFAPSFTAGTVHPAAGQYSPFSMTVERRPGNEQNLEGLELHMPPGLTAKIAGVPLCEEPLANAGNCSPESQIGTTTVAVGAGPHPFYQHGRIYLTGPYGGGPFGLSIVVPTTAGPFTLEGNTHRGEEVVRAAIMIDPKTAAATVKSDAIPQILDGVPLKVSKLNVGVERSNFELNPTNCTPRPGGITATLSSAGGAASEPGAAPFDVGGCGALKFKPSFTVSTQAKTSRTEGASLTVKVAQRPGEANIQKTLLQLPMALPSRLTTLQHACTEAQFAKDPSGCPPQSFVGSATAHTPLLSVPLSGPAILVSHGGAEFPDLDFMLEGEHVKIDLVGHTQIKKGITYSRFEEIPDNPISSFETSLPEGPHSALAANGNLCKQNLVMPTTLIAQNGAEVVQQTKISVTGCPPPDAPSRAELLKAALRTCRKTDKGHKKRRVACERRAHRRYGKSAKKASAPRTHAVTARGTTSAAGQASAPQAPAGTSEAAGVAGASRAADPAAEVSCPNEARRSESSFDEEVGAPYSSLLPECRAYEMVSPLEKQGFNAVPREVGEEVAQGGAAVGGIPVSPSGAAVGYYSQGLFAQPPAWQFQVAGYVNPYLAQRASGGWSTRSSYIPANLVERAETSGMLSDFAPDLISAQAGCGKGPSGQYACAFRSPDGSWTGAGRFAGVEGNIASTGRDDMYRGASADLSRLFMQPREMSLLPGDHLEGVHRGIYEVSGAGTGNPKLALVNLANDGKTELTREATVPGEGPVLGSAQTAYHAISQDGEKVFFTADSPGAGPGSGIETLYVRITPPGGSARTVDVSECKGGGTRCEPAETKPAVFEGASADGSRVFFMSEQQLLPAVQDSTQNLYQYDTVTETLTLLSGGAEHAEVQGVVRNSPDGSHVYFVAKGVLTAEKNTFGDEAGAGDDNLYAVDTGSQQVKFVGRLAATPNKDEGLWMGIVGPTGEKTTVDNAGARHAQTTPDGRDLVFGTHARLDHEDENGCSGAVEEGGVQVCRAEAAYRFDFQSGQLTWISHVRVETGFTAVNEERSAQIASPPVQLLGAYANVDDWNRAISGCPAGETFEGCTEAGQHDGEDIIFSTTERLTERDHNHAGDVYLWHCPSPCEHPAEEGEVRLISPGTHLGPSGHEEGVDLGNTGNTSWPGMTASGSDIFFFTKTALVPQDTDTLGDLYDARIGGGIPAPPAPAECSGEGCQSALAGEPLFAAPGSAVFSAGRNLAPLAASAVHDVSISHHAKPKKKHKKPKRHKSRRKHGH